MQSITSFFESVPSHHAGSSLPKVRKSPPSDPGTIRYTTDSHKRLKSSHIASTEGGEGASHVPQTTTKAEREVAVLYDPDPEQSRASSNTTLSHRLYLLGKNLPFLHPQSTAARHISKDLGPMAADMVWLQWEKSQSELSLTPNLHGKYDDNLKEPGPYITSTDVLTNVRQAIQTWASSSPSYQFCSDTQSELLNVSHKFVKLCDILNVFTDREPEFRAVIVVRHSFTARMLTTMIMSLMKTVKPQVLLGSDSNNGAQSMGCITNRNILRDFQEGNVNLLIIVSAVEASLNLPPVTCVIRWDPPDDYLAYAYSKAWLRPSGGTLVIMYEKGNRSHRRVMWHLRRMEPKWRTWMEESMNDNREKTFAPPCNMLYNDHFDEIAREDELGRDEAFLSDPVTSAKLYLSDSVRVVYMYVTRMSRLRGGAWNDELLFEYESVATSTRCHVWFSEPSPLRVFTGPICATRADARHLACFLACQELYRRCLLESTDWPTPRPSRALSFDDDLDDGVECQAPTVAPLTTEDARARMGKLKQLQYPQIQGEFWRRTLSAPPLRLFPTVFTLQGTPSNKTCHPICVMTRLPLPSITPFNIGPPGSSRTAHLRRGGAVNLTEEEVIALHQFTTLLCRTIYRKPVTLSIELCACLFAPLLSSWIDAHPPEDDIAPVHDMRDFIAWKETKRMGALMTARPRLSVESASSLIEDTKDALIQENNSQCSPLFEVAGISTTLNPTSKILSGGAEADYPNITEYLKVIRLPENTHPIKEDQPLMLVSSTPAHRDYFHHPTRPETTKKYVVPELCFRHPISASLFRTAVAIPPVLARIDDVMVSKELNATLFENRIDDSILADALTATSAERGHDYERLELLGDTILKFVVSAYLLVYLPNGCDGTNRSKSMAMKRNYLVSNAMLLKIMRKSGIPAYIRSNSIVTGAGDRIAPGLQLARVPQQLASAPTKRDATVQSDKGDGSAPSSRAVDDSVGNESEATHRAEQAGHQFLGNKTVSDVCEAIIGAAWLSGGVELALRCIKKIGLPLDKIDRWRDLKEHSQIPSPPDNIQLAQSVTVEMQEIIGLQLARPELLAWALTHGSATLQVHTPHQWLEFVGDGLLDYLVVPDIYNAHPEFGPGLLTSLKSTMVSTDALAALCVESGVADYFVCRSEAISSKLKVYTKALRLARADEHETSRKEARELRQYWKGIRPPKELADCFESLLGAILVSEGFDSRGCEIMYKKVMKPFFDKHIHVEEDVNPSAPSVLRNKLAKWKCRDVLVERTVNSPSEPNGALTQQCDIVVHGIVLARAEGPSRTAAYDMAEQLACEALDVDHEFIASNCDCHATSLEGGHAPARKQRRAALRMREELEETGAVEGLLGDLSSDTEDDEDDDDMDGVEIVEEEEADDEDEDSQGPGRSTRMGGRRHV